jgi:hypothetical protein
MTFARTRQAAVTQQTVTQAPPLLVTHKIESNHNVKVTSTRRSGKPRSSRVEHAHPQTARVAPSRPRTTPEPSSKPKPPPAPPPAAHPYRISDDFSGATIDPTVWHTITFGTGVTIGQTGGQLQIEFQADGQPGGQYNTLSAHYGTQCHFPGDFDARVEYTLLDWPQSSGVFVYLDAFFGNAGVGRRSAAQSGEIYSSWVQANDVGIPTADMTGALRIKRFKGIITTYVRYKGKWERLASGHSTGSVVLGPEAEASAADWTHQHVRIAFDNFVATATQVNCPPGSVPSTRLVAAWRFCGWPGEGFQERLPRSRSSFPLRSDRRHRAGVRHQRGVKGRLPR